MKQPTLKARKVIEALQNLLVANDGTIKQVTPPQIQTASAWMQSLVVDNQNTGKLLTDNQFSIIPYLLPFTLSTQLEISETAASIIEAQSQTITSLHLLQLQDRLRGGEWNFSAHLSQWNAMKFDRLSRFFKTNPHVVAMASFHHNGFVREAAIKHLNTLQDGIELPYLLIRLTDWVPQVAQRAKEALQSRLRQNYLHHFIENLFLIELLSKKKRGNAPEAIASSLFLEIHTALKATENRPLLLSGLTASSWETRRMSLRMLKAVRTDALTSKSPSEIRFEKIRLDSRQVIEAVLAEKDVTNRLLIFEFSNDLGTTEQIDLMIRLTKDPAPSIRRNVLELLCSIDSDSVKQNLERGLLDRSPLVREFARFKFIQSGDPIDFRQFYLNKLQSKPSAKVIASALAGLGEVGEEEDVDILIQFFEHPQIGVRKFATLALGRLSPQGHDDIFLRMLNQPSVGLSRAATNVISELPEPVDGAVLFEIFEQTHWKHVKLHAVRLFNSLPKWERIYYMLIASASKQSEIKKLATVYVESWEQRYRTTFQYSLPDLTQQKNFRSAFTALDHNLTPQVDKTLKACLALCSGTD